MKAKLIIIAGIKRSGSTWLYNAVRLILKHAGYTVAGGGLEAYDEHCGADYQIIKVHPFHMWLAQEADYVFTSDRDDDGIRASWKRFTGEELSDTELQVWRMWMCMWWDASIGKTPNYHVEYSELKWRPKQWIVMKIMDLLDIRYMLGECQMIAIQLDTIKPPTTQDYDPETLLFRNHITT